MNYRSTRAQPLTINSKPLFRRFKTFCENMGIIPYASLSLPLVTFYLYNLYKITSPTIYLIQAIY